MSEHEISEQAIMGFITVWNNPELFVPAVIPEAEEPRAEIRPCRIFADLYGRTLASIEQITDGGNNDQLIFTLDDGSRYRLHHWQDCCESVGIEDIVGDLGDLIGTPLTMAEEVSEDDPDASEVGEWTFYKLATINGYVTIRWYGSSNGYYSIGVNFDAC